MPQVLDANGFYNFPNTFSSHVRKTPYSNRPRHFERTTPALTIMIWFIPFAIVGFVAGPVVAKSILGVMGFGSAGPVAGGIAAGIQSEIGNIATGSIFASAQSAAMGGETPLIWNILCAAGAGVLALLIR